MLVIRNACLLLLVISGPLLAANYYRYENENGQVVMSQTIPADAVPRGYEVLSASGRVIEVVPRAPTAEELAAQSELERQKRIDAEQAVRDRKLLSIFSSPADAIRARDRKLEAIDVYIKVTQGNILKLQGDFNQAQSQAAERERSGQEVPDYLLDKMASLSRQIREAKEAIQDKNAEKAVISAEYEKDIKRLEYLVQAQEEKKQ